MGGVGFFLVAWFRGRQGSLDLQKILHMAMQAGEMDFVFCVQCPVVWREGVVCRIVEPIGNCEDNPDQAEDDEDKRPGFNA